MDQICPKRVLMVENEKSEHYHWALHIRISLSIKFHLELTILIFWAKFAQKEKGYFRSKIKKWTASLNSAFRISLAIKFHLKLTILIFRTKFAQKGISGWKEKSEHHHWVLHIRISLSIKFHLKLKILNFWPKFTQKGYFRSKIKKVNNIIDSTYSN